MAIMLSKSRQLTAFPIEIDAGVMGKGKISVRPLMFTEKYEEDLDKLKQEFSDALRASMLNEDEEKSDELKKKSEEAENKYNEHFMKLFADWDICAEAEDIAEVCEISIEAARAQPKTIDWDGVAAELGSPIGTMYREETKFVEQFNREDLIEKYALYKVPVCIKAMSLFSKLEGSSLMTILLEAMRKIPLASIPGGSRTK
jgi:hypothetical protein